MIETSDENYRQPSSTCEGCQFIAPARYKCLIESLDQDNYKSSIVKVVHGTVDSTLLKLRLQGNVACYQLQK